MVASAAKGVFPCGYELWAYGDQQCPCDPDLHAVAASSLFPAALSEPGSCRMGPHGAAGRVLERRSPPPGEMFSQLYGTGCTTLCAMSASVQEKQAALSQLPARLLPPAVRAPPAAMRAKIDRLARHQLHSCPLLCGSDPMAFFAAVTRRARMMGATRAPGVGAGVRVVHGAVTVSQCV